MASLLTVEFMWCNMSQLLYKSKDTKITDLQSKKSKRDSYAHNVISQTIKCNTVFSCDALCIENAEPMQNMRIIVAPVY